MRYRTGIVLILALAFCTQALGKAPSFVSYRLQKGDTISAVIEKRSLAQHSPLSVLQKIKALNPEVKDWGRIQQGQWVRLPKESFESYSIFPPQKRQPASTQAQSLIQKSFHSDTLHEGVFERQVKQVLQSKSSETLWRWALSVYQESQRWGSVEFADRTEAELLSEPSWGGQLRWWRPGQLIEVEWTQLKLDNPRWVIQEVDLFRGRFQKKVGPVYLGGGFLQQGYLRALSGSDLTVDVITHPSVQISMKPYLSFGVFHLESEFGVTYQLSASSSELDVNSYLLSFAELRLQLGSDAFWQPSLFVKYESGEVSTSLTRQDLRQLRFGLGLEF